MRKIIYQQPHVIVRIINPEELLQITINSGDDPIPGDDADAKYKDFDDDDDISSSIWED
jgi:hypothetical protein